MFVENHAAPASLSRYSEALTFPGDSDNGDKLVTHLSSCLARCGFDKKTGR